MLEAAGELLAEHGPEGVTHLEVARTAGVARATVYRHWPDRAAILLDLLRMNADLELVAPPPDAPIADRLEAILTTFASALNGEGGRTLAAMIGLAEWDADVFMALERMTEFGPTFLKTLILAGIDDGSLSPDADPDLLADMLIGPLYFRRLLYHDHLDGAYIEILVQRIIGPILTS
jgi:AcrR family transcriptional regulator